MDNIYSRIKSIQIQGAINIAYEALKHLKSFARKQGFGSSFNKECNKLLKIRPTAVPLFNVINEVKKDRSISKIDELLLSIRDSKKKIAKIKLFKKKTTVMTHCHSSEAVALLKANMNVKKIYVTETRPKNQGLLTAKELKKSVLIVDSAIGYYMEDTDAVLVGSDAIRKEGIINKIGTLPLAIAANEFGKPFYVVASSLKIDKRKSYRIEMRNPREVGIINVKALNPAFDLTPWKYVTAVITEDGIKKPKQILLEMRK